MEFVILNQRYEPKMKLSALWNQGNSLSSNDKMQAYVAELLLSISHSWAQMLLLTLSSHVSHPFSSTHKPYQVMSELAGSCCTQKQDGALELYKKPKFKDSWLKASCFIGKEKTLPFIVFNSSLTDVGKRSYRCRYRMHAYNNNAWDKGTLRDSFLPSVC